MNVNVAIEPLCAVEGVDACMGIALDRRNGALYFAANGKFVFRHGLGTGVAPGLVATIEEGTGRWNDEYGDVFLHEMKLGDDGYLYAAAERRILRIDPRTGHSVTLVDGGFSGSWGAYGLSLDRSGNLLVGDHKGGIHLYVRQADWSERTIVGREASASFGGVEALEDAILYLDFERSLLVRAGCRWNGSIPEVSASQALETGLNYPEFMQVWGGDVFVKAARGENVLVRVRKGEVVQRIHLSCDGAGPIVTFVIDPIDARRANFYGTSWTGTLYAGELAW